MGQNKNKKVRKIYKSVLKTTFDRFLDDVMALPFKKRWFVILLILRGRKRQKQEEEKKDGIYR